MLHHQVSVLQQVCCKTNTLLQMKTYTLRGEKVNVFVNKYGNNRPAIYIADTDGLPFMIATLNVPERPLEEDEVVIKNYSENEGIYDWLLERNIIQPMIGSHQLAYNRAPICVLNSEEEWVDENASLSEIDDYLD